MKMPIVKKILKIWGKTTICYLLASLACLITAYFGLFLTNFTEGWTIATRQLFAHGLAQIPVFIVCWKLSLAEGYNLSIKSEFSFKRYLIGNLITMAAWIILAFLLSLLYIRIAHAANIRDFSAPYYLLYFCMLPISLLWYAEVPMFVLLGTLIMIVPFTFLRIFAAVHGNRRYKVRFPSESETAEGEGKTEKKRHWKDSLN